MEKENKESILSEYNVEEVTAPIAIQSLQLLDKNNSIIATHKVYALNSFCINNEMEGGNPPIKELGPFPIYMCMIESYVNGRGIGLKLWKYGETVLHSRSSKPYYRLVQDITDNGWSKRHLPEFIEHLRKQNINVEVVSEKEEEDDDYFCLLLIGKQEDSAKTPKISNENFVENSSSFQLSKH